MFIQKQKNLAFVKSVDIQAFPCGRRRIPQKVDGEFSIPFDPEARLNTEANNRKHVGLNGYTQTFLRGWNVDDCGLLSLSLAGYLFEINLPKAGTAEDGSIQYIDVDAFGTALEERLGITDTKIYANILIKDTPLFAGSPKDYTTKVLDTQSSNIDVALDLLRDQTPEETLVDKTDINNYYFSGLSFSTSPLTGSTITHSEVVVTKNADGKDILPQTKVSLCILEKVEGKWKIHQPALLPKIEHGTTKESIVLGDTLIERRLDDEDNVITEGNIIVDNKVITKDLDASGVILATEELENDVNNIVARKVNVTSILTAATADIETANITDVTVANKLTATEELDSGVANIDANKIAAKTFIQSDNPVPIIDVVEQTDSYWQLQLTRVSVKPKN